MGRTRNATIAHPNRTMRYTAPLLVGLTYALGSCRSSGAPVPAADAIVEGRATIPKEIAAPAEELQYKAVPSIQS